MRSRVYEDAFSKVPFGQCGVHEFAFCGGILHPCKTDATPRRTHFVISRLRPSGGTLIATFGGFSQAAMTIAAIYILGLAGSAVPAGDAGQAAASSAAVREVIVRF
jgi:hypothetical protein